jgi:serine/threonine-protein kinase
MIPTTSDRHTFLDHLRQSGLLSRQQLQDAEDQLGVTGGATDLARAMVKGGFLTRFQARMLLVGRSSGFFVGPYRILEKIGQGGMGKVYKAVHETMKRTVALKVLSPNLVKTEKARALFKNEVQTAARLNHPNIVQAYDANAVDGRHFLAMEFVAGLTLGQVVHQRGVLPIGSACEVIRQAALGLQHAYELGLVHRDIKPANLMVSVVRGAKAGRGRLQVKILDFGLARLNRRRQTAPANDPDAGRHPITGTPDYMSPEQARNRDAVDIRSDLYSLGCTFYYLLTGKAPFAGGAMLDKLIRHNSELPISPEKLRRRTPPAVAAIVLKLLAKDPADRFQTPQQLADALAPHSHSRAIRQARKARRRKTGSPVPTAMPVDKTLGPGHEATAPHICLPPVAAPTDEDVRASWLEIYQEHRRQRRRRMTGAVVAIAGLLTAAVVAAVVWLQ